MKGYLEGGECYVAKEDEVVIGVYVLVKKVSSIEVMNIAVEGTHRGRGIGKKLVLDALHRAKQMGVESVEIGTGNSSIGQLALYQKCGFRITGVQPGFFEEYDEEIIENGIVCRDMIRLSYAVN